MKQKVFVQNQEFEIPLNSKVIGLLLETSTNFVLTIKTELITKDG